MRNLMLISLINIILILVLKYSILISVGIIVINILNVIIVLYIEYYKDQFIHFPSREKARRLHNTIDNLTTLGGIIVIVQLIILVWLVSKFILLII